MKYTQGRIGRIFLLKFDNGDVVLDELSRLAKKEKVRSAVFIFLGALKKGHLVTGPKKPVIPPKPNWLRFKDGLGDVGRGHAFSVGRRRAANPYPREHGQEKKVPDGVRAPRFKSFFGGGGRRF